jgi:hypothetical protein
VKITSPHNPLIDNHSGVQWEREELTMEMVVEHILPHLVKLLAAVEAIKVTLRSLRADVDSLIAHTGINPKHKSAAKCPAVPPYCTASGQIGPPRPASVVVGVGHA